MTVPPQRLDLPGPRDSHHEQGWMRQHHRPDAWIDQGVQTARAQGLIIDAALAHAIGERLDPPVASHLGEFLIYDILLPYETLTELSCLGDGPEAIMIPHSWRFALREFLADATERATADRAAGELEPTVIPSTELRPMLYVSRSRQTAGRWIDMTRSPEVVEHELLGLPGDPRDVEWAVHGRMGFGHVYPLHHPEIELMGHIARGIDRHGEAYAAYAEYAFQRDLSEEDFLARFRGTFPTLDAAILAQAEARGWLAAVSALADQHGLHGVLTLDVEALTARVFADGLAVEPGTRGHHVFGPAQP